MAEPIFVIAGDGATGVVKARDYLKSVAKDPTKEPYLVEKNQRVFSAAIVATEKLAKLALGTKDSVIAYDGHSNFGIGFAFAKGLRGAGKNEFIRGTPCR